MPRAGRDISNVRRMPPPEIIAGSPRSLGMRASLIRAAILADLTPRLYRLNLSGMSCLKALFHIGAHPGITQSRLADELELSRTSATRICDRLERARYLVRAKGADARTHELCLTPSGLAAVNSASDQCIASEERLFGILDDEQRTIIENLLDKVLSGVRNGRSS